MGAMSRIINKRVLVTGGLGFIGSNLSLALRDAGNRVTVLDSLVEGHGGKLANLDGADDIEVVIGDISDHAVVAEIAGRVDIVFNVAGQVSHHDSMLDPTQDTRINVFAQLDFLETLRRVRPDACVVHTSTRQVYGMARYLPVDEDHPTIPRDVNGANKLAGESYHRLYGEVHGMRTVCLRLSNIFGPRQCLDKSGLGFMPVFIARALRGEDLVVFGEGEQTRDLLLVDDLVSALLEAGKRLEDGSLPSGQVINVGHDEVYSLRDIATQVCAIADSGSRVRHEAWPVGLDRIDVGAFRGDYDKARRLLGWQGSTPFEQSVERTLDFYRANPWYL